MRLFSSIPVLQPIALTTGPFEQVGSPQPIIQLKELEVDKVRYTEWLKQVKPQKPLPAKKPVDKRRR